MLDLRFLLGSILMSAAFAFGVLWMLGVQDTAGGGFGHWPSVQTAAAPREPARALISGPVIVELPDRPPPEMPTVTALAVADEPEITGSFAPPQEVPLPVPRTEEQAKEEQPRPRRSRQRAAPEPKQPEIFNPFELFFSGLFKDAKPAAPVNQNLN